MAAAAPRRSRRAEAQARSQARVEAAEEVLRRELTLLWRIQVLSYLMVRRLHADPSLTAGLSLVAWRVLLTLSHVPGLSAHEITALWGFEKMAVNRAVKELTARKLIAGGPDPNGGRRIPLALTPAGMGFHAAIWPNAVADYDTLAAALPEEELKALSTLMDKLITQARRIANGEE